MQIINDQESMFSGGVVHSFDGTIDDLNQVLSVRKLSIGINVILGGSASALTFMNQTSSLANLEGDEC